MGTMKTKEQPQTKERTIYDLKLNEIKSVDEPCYYRRVPGGWIVVSYDRLLNGYNEIRDIKVTAVFVAYNEEFKISK